MKVYRLQSDIETTRVVQLSALLDRLRLAVGGFALGAGGQPVDGISRLDWIGDPEAPLSDFPSDQDWCPLLSAEIAHPFRDELERCGRLLPISIGETDYVAFAVDHFADCLDRDRSVGIRRTRIERPVFVTERIPRVPAFRLAESPNSVFWTESFVRRFFALGPAGIIPIVIWSTDRLRTVGGM